MQVEKAEDGRIICKLMNRTDSIIYEGMDLFIDFLTYLQKVRTTEELSKWGRSYQLSEKMITETLHTLLEDKIILTGDQAWSFDGKNRLWSYLASQTTSLDVINQCEHNWKKSRIGIIGAGGVGSRVAHELAAMGIPSLVLVDPDCVSDHNLTHQPIFPKDSVGELKVDVLKKIFTAQYGTSITSLPLRITPSLSPKLLDHLQDCTAVVICADEPSVDQLADWLTPYLAKRGIPHLVGGGYHGHSTSTGTTIIPGVTGCWTCFDHLLDQHKQIPIAHRHISGITGSFNPLVSFLANIIVSDIIAIITKLWRPLLFNRMGDFDLFTGKFTWRVGEKKEHCQVCNHIV